MLGGEVIMYSITILIETHCIAAVINQGKRCLLNLYDKRSSLIEIIYYSISRRDDEPHK